VKIVFLADAHISGIDDPNQLVLAGFLDSLASSENPPDKVVLLGDIFDFWMGFNEVVEREYSTLLKALIRLHERGIEIIYIEGNHDYSMGPFFTETLKARVYGDDCEMKLDGKRIFLSHGDRACGDVKYLFWRWFLRNIPGKLLAEVLGPLRTWSLAKYLSKESRGYGGRSAVVEQGFKGFIKEKISEGFDIVILAHSHKNTIEDADLEGKVGRYINPGSFADDGSYILYEAGTYTLREYGT
jgi:UDP-2,3-diacylglucosamine hydrolase